MTVFASATEAVEFGRQLGRELLHELGHAPLRDLPHGARDLTAAGLAPAPAAVKISERPLCIECERRPRITGSLFCHPCFIALSIDGFGEL